VQVDVGVKEGRDASEVMQVVSDSGQQVIQVEGGVKDGRDSSGRSPVDVTWALGHAASSDLCALPGVSKVHPGCGGLGRGQEVLSCLHGH
jgi:hypothetical protein